MTRRRAGAVVVLLMGVALAFGSPATAGSSERLFTASASGAAVHGFYDHQGTLPVPLLDLSVPYTEATFEPGPNSTALGSFLWDPQAAELGTIFCQLSNGQMCQIPSYPFQAQASYPSNGQRSSPPRLSISKKGAPARVRGADEAATASGHGSHATGTVGGLAAIPMSGAQRRAATGLAAALNAVRPASLTSGGQVSAPSLPLAPPSRPVSLPPPSTGGAAKPSRWLMALGVATSSSVTHVSPGGAVAQGFSAASDVELLGGLIQMDAVRGEAVAAIGSSATGKADAHVAGASVGGFRAKVGPSGIQIQDKRLGGPQRKAVQAALDKALKGAGIRVTLGRKQVQRTKKEVNVEAYALALQVDKQVVPPSAPEGANGKDVLEVPLGYASAQAERSSLGIGGGGGGALPPPPAAAPNGGIAPPAPVPAAPAAAGVGGGAPPPPGPAAPPAPNGGTKAPKAVAAPVQGRPASGPLGLGVPGIVIAVVAIGAAGAVAGLTWLKALEVLAE